VVDHGPEPSSVNTTTGLSGSVTIDTSKTGTNWGRVQLRAAANAPSTFLLYCSVTIWDCDVAGRWSVFAWRSMTTGTGYSGGCVALNAESGRVGEPNGVCSGIVTVPAGGTVSLDLVLITPAAGSGCTTISHGGDNGSGWIVEL
jgi:hypothetical protein